MVGKDSTFQSTCDAAERRSQRLAGRGHAAVLSRCSSPTFTCGGWRSLNCEAPDGCIPPGKPPGDFQPARPPSRRPRFRIMGWWWKGKCIEGSPESEIHPDLAPKPGEKVIPKHRYSAFYNTDLETVLRCLKVEDVVISGIMTNMCCEFTARDAYYRDLRIFIPADGTDRSTRKCTWQF